MKKIIILDRDGVINEDSDDYVKSPEEWIPIKGSIEAIAKLSKNNYDVYIATNQSGIARGYYDIEILNKMHEKMRRLVTAEGGTIKEIKFCPHGPDDNCACRKPQNGMFKAISDSNNLKSLDGIYTVGDSQRDLVAGASLGCKTILVKTGKGTRTLKDKKELPEGTQVFEDLSSFVDCLLSEHE